MAEMNQNRMDENGMNQDGVDQDGARLEALRRVVERVTAWQETATEGTIHDELEKALREAGVTLTDEQKERVTQEIADGGDVNVDALAADTGEGGPA